MKKTYSIIFIFIFIISFSLISLVSAQEYYYADNITCVDDDCVFTCPFEPREGRIIIDLNSERLLANSAQSSHGSVFPVDIPAGDYKVSLVSFDGYENRSNAYQIFEEWYLTLFNDDGVIIYSNAISDLPDDVDYVGAVEVVDDSLTLFKNIDGVQAIHAHFGSGAQSVETVCAVFDLIDDNPYCEDVDDDRIIVDFQNTRLRIDQDFDDAIKGPFYTLINSGNYSVTLVSSDGYVNRKDVFQFNEEWFITLFNSSNLVTASGITNDVPDGVDYASVVSLVNDGLVIDDDVDEIFISHAWYPPDDNYSSPQSVNAQCAIFELVNDDDFCSDADEVFDVDLVVASETYSSDNLVDEVSLNIQREGNHSILGVIQRGELGQCQTGEAFFLEVNNVSGPISSDDIAPCIISNKLEHLGFFNFNEGENDVLMHTTNDLSSANSVNLNKICIYYGDEEEEPILGNLNVCKRLFNDEDELVSGSDIDAMFKLSLTGLPDVIFETPLNYNGSNCILYDDLPLGVYEFGEEVISSPNSSISWDEPLYNFNYPNGSFDFFNDGEVVLSEDEPNKTIVISNKFEIIEPSPILGSFEVCKFIYDESDSLVSGFNLNSTFTLPLVNLSDAVFNTHLTYKGNMNCIYYGDLPLGAYEFGNEIISSPSSILWGAPEYLISLPNGSFDHLDDSEIILTEDDPNKILEIHNNFKINESNDEPQEPQEPDEEFGTLTVCKYLFNESNNLVSNNLFASFTLPLNNLTDAIFNTPLNYDGEINNCITYHNLSLGTYEFSEEIINSNHTNMTWDDPLYKISDNIIDDVIDDVIVDVTNVSLLNVSDFSDDIGDGLITLSSNSPNKTITILNKFSEDEVEIEPVLGNLKVCKQLHASSNGLVAGDEINASFTLPLANLPNATFNTPLNYEDNLNCILYEDLPLGAYEFGEEVIESNNDLILWTEPLYNLNYYDDKFSLFDDVGGVIVLSVDAPNRTIVISNRFAINDIEPSPILGSFEVCKEIYDESDSLVSGFNLNSTFTLPLVNLSDAVFSTHLTYKSNMNCVYYGNLPLGVYEFGDEVIYSPNSSVLWGAPEYRITFPNESFILLEDNEIDLSEDNPDVILTILNNFEINESVPEEPPVEEPEEPPEEPQEPPIEEPPEEPPVEPPIDEPNRVMGNLEICKQIYNESNHLVSGVELGVEFILPLMNLSNAKLSTPLNYDDGLNCVLYENLSLGTYKFGNEIIDPHNYLISWDEPLYNFNYPNGSFDLFDDGEIILSVDSPNQTLVILNRFTVDEPSDPVEPRGSFEVCKEIYDESDSLVSGFNLNSTFTLPLVNLSDAIFSTHLTYKSNMNCVYYGNLPLGVYEFGDEVIYSPNSSILWGAPDYRITLPNDSFVLDDNLIVLSEDNPNVILTILNNFEINESVNESTNESTNLPQEIVTDKRISNPKEQMSFGNIELGHNYFSEENNFYPALTSEFCSSQDENCMGVTLNTKIDLACLVDGANNTSWEEGVYFKVYLDGVDVSDDYCESYQGVFIDDANNNNDVVNNNIMNNDVVDDNNITDFNGYCYMAQGINSFYFLEESWHRLDYFCESEDVVSDLDVEYFKVEGSAFEIELNEKWNLISVPMQLLTDSLDDLFEGHDNVVSVWTFNNSNWSVWSPNAPSTLDTMHPGWGYFVLTTNASTLTVGGSLLSPIISPPSKIIVDGWNLIGYYGSNDAPINEDNFAYYAGPNNVYGKPINCALATLINDEGDVPFPSLLTYWGPNNPNAWRELDATNSNHLMNPGAGYWLFYSKDKGIYAPSTKCNTNY